MRFLSALGLTTLLASLALAQPDPKFKRGALPTPKAKIAAAPQFTPPRVGAPPQFSMVPDKLSMWGNSQYGVCVTSERAFAYGAWSKFCTTPIFVPEAEVIRWARKYDVLNGTWAEFVLSKLQTDGFVVDGKMYKGGPFAYVDYKDTTVLKQALTTGPVTIAIAADALPNGAGNVQGWYAVGPKGRHNTDHEVGLWGYGTAKYLCDSIKVPVPTGLDPNKEMFGLFTWSTMGLVDHPWLLDTCVEAWVSVPTVAGMTPSATNPTAKLTANPATVTPGQATTITWETTNATAVTLNGQPVVGSGSQSFTPTATTPFTLIATGAEGTTPAMATATVTVSGPPPAPFAGTLAQVVNGETIAFDPVKKVVTLPPGWTVAGGGNGGQSFEAELKGAGICPAAIAAALQLAADLKAKAGMPVILTDLLMLYAAYQSCQQAPAGPMSASPGGVPSGVMAAAGDCQQFGFAAGACSSAAGSCGQAGSYAAAAPAGDGLLYRATHPFGGRFGATVTAGSCSTSAAGSSCEASARSYRFAPFGGALRFRR